MTNISVIGCGRWGPNHIRNFSSLSDSTVVSAVDTQSEPLSRISKNFPNVHPEQDYRRVLENSDLDAVVVATPTNTHYAIVRDALLANKHVMCEKPLCQTSKEAEELIELADERNLILMIGHVFLFNNNVLIRN